MRDSAPIPLVFYLFWETLCKRGRGDSVTTLAGFRQLGRDPGSRRGSPISRRASLRLSNPLQKQSSLLFWRGQGDSVTTLAGFRQLGRDPSSRRGSPPTGGSPHIAPPFESPPKAKQFAFLTRHRRRR